MLRCPPAAVSVVGNMRRWPSRQVVGVSRTSIYRALADSRSTPALTVGEGEAAEPELVAQLRALRDRRRRLRHPVRCNPPAH